MVLQILFAFYCASSNCLLEIAFGAAALESPHAKQELPIFDLEKLTSIIEMML